ncbi:hypothetical protein DSO57_1038038 [Entomophthora muscae]|uniref:Uncharacterized protein n=1 Tax=Entomophthora muscae TaxID=34485 RepID=A0ACC2U872_9FUNG|nr:hypothetical protein DSO57_1038038 [Entomophthora muscae]
MQFSHITKFIMTGTAVAVEFIKEEGWHDGAVSKKELKRIESRTPRTVSGLHHGFENPSSPIYLDDATFWTRDPKNFTGFHLKKYSVENPIASYPSTRWWMYFSGPKKIMSDACLDDHFCIITLRWADKEWMSSFRQYPMYRAKRLIHTKHVDFDHSNSIYTFAIKGPCQATLLENRIYRAEVRVKNPWSYLNIWSDITLRFRKHFLKSQTHKGPDALLTIQKDVLVNGQDPY